MTKRQHLSADKLKDIAKLILGGLNNTQIGARVGVSRFTVSHIKERLFKADICSRYSLELLSNQQLVDICYLASGTDNGTQEEHVSRSEFMPDFLEMAVDRLERHMSKQFYYFNYMENCIANKWHYLSRSQFYHYLKKAEDELFAKTADPVFIMDKTYGLSCEIDFAGKKCALTLPGGVKTDFNVFVIVWSASCYVFARFVERQTTEATCIAISAAFKHFNCLPQEIIPDNAKAWVEDHSIISEPIINKSFEDFMSRFDVFVHPTSPRAPTHKSRVEYAVRLITERVINNYDSDTPRSLEEHNHLLQDLIEKRINQAQLRGDLEQNRAYLFEHCEKPKARAMISTIPQFAHIYILKVPRNYHITFGTNKYSVPYTYIGQVVTVRVYENILTISCDDRLIATHPINFAQNNSVNTIRAHMPENHKAVQDERKYLKIEQALDEAFNLSKNLHSYCSWKNKQKNGHALKACVAAINFYKGSANTELADKTFMKIMQMEPAVRNITNLVQIYKQMVSESLKPREDDIADIACTAEEPVINEPRSYKASEQGNLTFSVDDDGVLRNSRDVAMARKLGKAQENK